MNTKNKIDFRVEHSKEDNSVNFIDSSPVSGFYESRYVRRGEDYFIVYLSVQSACNLGCRMCHLTATKQKKVIDNTESIWTYIMLEKARFTNRYYNPVATRDIIECIPMTAPFAM